MHLETVASSFREEILTMQEKQIRKDQTYSLLRGENLKGQIDSLLSTVLDQQSLIRQCHEKSTELSHCLSGDETPLPAPGTSEVQMAGTNVPSWRSKTPGRTCLCHRRRFKRTARSISRMFGALYIAYSGIPYLNSRCRSCNALERGHPPQADVLLSFTYLFPAWLVPWAMTLVVNGSQPKFDYNFRVFHCVSYSSQIFQCAYQGDVPGMKRILQNKAGSPFDVTSEPQHSLLVVSYALPHLNSWILIRFGEIGCSFARTR